MHRACFLFPFLDLLAFFTHPHHPALRITVGMRQAKLNGEVAVAEAGKASSEEAKPRLCFVFFFLKKSFEDTDGGLLLLHDGALTEHRLSNVPSMWGF